MLEIHRIYLYFYTVNFKLSHNLLLSSSTLVRTVSSFVVISPVAKRDISLESLPKNPESTSDGSSVPFWTFSFFSRLWMFFRYSANCIWDLIKTFSKSHSVLHSRDNACMFALLFDIGVDALPVAAEILFRTTKFVRAKNIRIIP